ncbi:DnaJ domain protein [Talaromyces proteolyticus]|uniref:DnaJ domain protein n=1 Tax=Talaromyces proteolyticus TaxID=1131652 RepID=A0AAD4KX34_9EURO|nr:DnaJ domain protein [Talaromyces proteolyticus]KAH8702084.1 DnaJ domain protein [Talaromyces proteolyticus]
MVGRENNAPRQEGEGSVTHINGFSSGAANDDFEILRDYPDEPDYYSMLGFSRHPPPTESQLRAAYHNLTLSFHPDKQPPHLLEAAKRQFRNIQQAYETLVDPQKRIVYDLQGAEGVEQLWGARGVMGKLNGVEDGSRRQLGPRAMLPDEFRLWFLKRMREREREMLDEMVGAQGAISISLDATSLISTNLEGDGVQLNVPTVRPSHYVLKYSFKTPLPSFAGLWPSVKDDNDIDDIDGAPVQENKSQLEPESSAPELTFNASIGGGIRDTIQRVKYEEDGIQKTDKVNGPPIVVSRAFTLSGNITHSFTGLGLRAGSPSRLRSLMDGAAVTGEFGIFPIRSLAISFSKPVVPFPQGRPISVTVTGIVPSYPRQFMPTIGLNLSRQIGRYQHGSISFSSGTNLWPQFIQDLLAPTTNTFAETITPFLMPQQPSSLQLKYIATPDSIPQEQAELLGLSARPVKNEVWQCGVGASPMGGSLSLEYGRTIFGNRLEEPPRSEWNLDGYYPISVPKSFRGVRIVFDATLDLLGNASWNIGAKRQVSALSSIGVAIGVRSARGLVMSLSWTRLGQSIKLPIAVCPLDLVNPELSFWAVMVPWLTYVGIEFTYLRPRERRQRLQAINRRRKRLKARIPARRLESARQIEMMAEYVQRRQERQHASGGLVIERAEYGYTPPKNINDIKSRNTELAEQKIIDVTIPVAALVEKSQLVISQNTIRFQIIGFYDPAPLLPKVLKIWYTFNHQQHYTEAQDGEDIYCPKREDISLESD